MRAVIQRVSRASVTVEGNRVSEIGNGLLILLGIGPEDDEEKSRAMTKKSQHCGSFRMKLTK